MWISLVYEPKRWMKKESYYKAQSLYRKYLRGKKNQWLSGLSGEIGQITGIRFIESRSPGK